ncbi:MAG: STAS domain-containing protein [Phycisphaerae bacterium]|nr:STAS domain-containing protein [Phycisphaerae bacterium]
MAIQNWSDEIIVVELGDDPQFSEDLMNLLSTLESRSCDVVLNFAAVSFINSSNIAKLLRLRKQMIANQRRLVLCDVNTQVWGVFMVTGLDKIFEFINDISAALATVQIANGADEAPSDA